MIFMIIRELIAKTELVDAEGIHEDTDIQELVRQIESSLRNSKTCCV